MNHISCEEEAIACASKIEILKEILESISCDSDREAISGRLRDLEAVYLKWEQWREDLFKNDPKVQGFLNRKPGDVVRVRRPMPSWIANVDKGLGG